MNKSFKNLLLSAIIGGTCASAFASGPDISGYFDMAFVAPEGKESYWRQQHVNLLLNHSVDKFKFFSEIEFEDAVDFNVGRSPKSLDNKSAGRLFMERAYIEYAFSESLSARFGQLLHSSLYYENHYPSVINNYTDPLTRKTIWTYNVKGMEVFGEKNGIIYQAWTGRGPVVGGSSVSNQHESGTDYGGKLGIHLKSKSADLKFSVLGASYFYREGAPKTKAFGAELSYSQGAFLLWSEYGVRGEERTASGSLSKDREMAGYVMGSYAFDLGASGEFSPFLMLDQYKKDVATVSAQGTLQRAIFGFAYRPVPTVTIKVDYSNAISGKNTAKYTDDLADGKKSTMNKIGAQIVYFYN